MFKFLGQLIGHSFGFAIMAMAVTFGAPVAILLVYTSGYALIPFIHIIGMLRQARVKRKMTKINMTSNEYLANFNYVASKKQTKKLDKIVRKKAKKTDLLDIIEKIGE